MISSYVDLLATEYGDELGDEADEYIEYAVDGAERMQDMIDGLLDYSRVRSQGEAFTEVDAATVAEQVRRDLELLAEEHGATVTVDDLPTVEADRDQLAQVFRNLVENALEHGGTTVRVGAERRDDAVVFSVADDGPGIPEDEQDAVFDLFEQRDRDSDGTGMGLAICRRIVDRHGGDIWVESEPGEGTTFRFSVPD
jgi:signal transduction histidine kinase